MEATKKREEKNGNNCDRRVVGGPEMISILSFRIVNVSCGECRLSRAADAYSTIIYSRYFFPHPIDIVLLGILSKPAMNEIFLVLVSYVIILTFLAIEICIFFAATPR